MSLQRIARAVLTIAFLTASAMPVIAHPAPFSYVDLYLSPGSAELSLVVHVFDAGHDLRVDPPARLLDQAFLAARSDALVALLAPRIQLTAGGATLTAKQWSPAEALPERQSVRLQAKYDVSGSPGVFTIDARMFPYDTAHQTFVNIYEGESLTLQAILDAGKARLDYYAGSRHGALAVGRRFVPSGLRHILLGPDHLLFLLGLLLLGGTSRQLLWLAGGFAAGDLAAFVLTLLNLARPPARFIEPAIALSIVYVGADNLMVRGGRDMRMWIAAGFGLIHGFWFANGLRQMDLPALAFRWSLASFDAGVELGHILAVLLAGTGIAALWRRSPDIARRVLYVGSGAVIVAGIYFFVQRVFFPGGIV